MYFAVIITTFAMVAVIGGIVFLTMSRQKKKYGCFLEGLVGPGAKLDSSIKCEFNALPYKVLLQRPAQKRPGFFSITVSSEKLSQFSVRSENAADVFFKSLGISKEHQTGDRAFDEALYLACDDSIFANRYFNEPARREALMEIFKFSPASVSCESGELVVRWVGPAIFKSGLEQQHLEELVAHLATLVKDAPQGEAEFLGQKSDSFKQKSSVCTAVAIVLAGAGIALSVFGAVFYQTFDLLGVFVYSLPYAAILCILFSLYAVQYLRGRSDSHIVLMAVIGFSLPGICGTMFGAAILLNAIGDDEPAIVYRQAIVEKRMQSGKSRSYYIDVAAWRPNKQSETIEVNRENYERAVVNVDLLELAVRPGKLGFAWLENYSLIRQ